MELGAFSVSLAVKDLEASRKFYEKFGFKIIEHGFESGDRFLPFIFIWPLQRTHEAICLNKIVKRERVPHGFPFTLFHISTARTGQQIKKI